MSNNKDFFDDMMDINRDGKFDGQDMFLNQMIYNEVMKNNKDNKSTYSSNKPSYSSSNNIKLSGCGAALYYLCIAFVALGLILFAAACCQKKKKKSSYSSYSTRRSYSNYSRRYSSSRNNSYSSRSSSYSSNGGYSYKSKSKSSSKSSDPYNAKDYYDADDLYYDYPDDFWDYEDAEDYYNEHHDD